MVDVPAPERVRGLDESDAADHLVTRVVAVGPEIVGVGQAAAMRDEVTHRHLPRRPRIIHREGRQVLRDGIIPAHLPFVHQHA